MSSDRRDFIRGLFAQKPFVSLKELKELFPYVSSMTLRRDIEYFESQGDAIKVRGGARSMKFITSSTDDSITTRMNENVSSKEKIASRAADFLETGRSIFIDSGSTLQRMVSCVPNDRYTFITTNPSAALELSKIGMPLVNIVGGKLDRDYQSVSGMQAMKFLADVNIDIAFLSPSGLTAKSGFTGGNYSECELKRAVVEKARLVVMLMDSSKTDKCLPYTFCTMKDINVLITDGDIVGELFDQAEEHGVEVINVNKINE